MKAGHLERKTSRTRLPGGEIRVFDLTAGIAPARPDSAGLFRTDTLAGTLALLRESPTAYALLENALEAGWEIELADLNNNGYSLEIENGLIVLDNYGLTEAGLEHSPHFRHAVLISLARALRDVWHEESERTDPARFSPENLLMLERLRAADCDTLSVLIAWELRGAGEGAVWRHLLGSEDSDLAMLFSRYLERDPSALFSGSVLAYTFRQWFADEARVNAADHDTLEYLDEYLAIAGEHDPFGRTRLEGEIAENLSELPDGRAYLAGLGGTILCDPFFSGLNDEINQAHLFHIVYETEAVIINNVPFRDADLARKIFPGKATPRRRM